MKLFESVNEFCKGMEFKDVALDELCCCALGIAIGMCIPAKKHIPILLGTSAVAVTACVPLVTKLSRTICAKETATFEEESSLSEKC